MKFYKNGEFGDCRYGKRNQMTFQPSYEEIYVEEFDMKKALSENILNFANMLEDWINSYVCLGYNGKKRVLTNARESVEEIKSLAILPEYQPQEFSYFSTYGTYAEAKAECLNEGGWLFTLDDNEEDRNRFDYFLSLMIIPWGTRWIETENMCATTNKKGEIEDLGEYVGSTEQIQRCNRGTHGLCEKGQYLPQCNEKILANSNQECPTGQVLKCSSPCAEKMDCYDVAAGRTTDYFCGLNTVPALHVVCGCPEGYIWKSDHGSEKHCVAINECGCKDSQLNLEGNTWSLSDIGRVVDDCENGKCICKGLLFGWDCEQYKSPCDEFENCDTLVCEKPAVSTRLGSHLKSITTADRYELGLEFTCNEHKTYNDEDLYDYWHRYSVVINGPSYTRTSGDWMWFGISHFTKHDPDEFSVIIEWPRLASGYVRALCKKNADGSYDWNKVKVFQDYDDATETYTKTIFANGEKVFEESYNVVTDIHNVTWWPFPYNGNLGVNLGPRESGQFPAEGSMNRNFYYRKLEAGGCLTPEGEYVDKGFRTWSCERGNCECGDDGYICDALDVEPTDPCENYDNCTTFICSTPRYTVAGAEGVIAMLIPDKNYQIGFEMTCYDGLINGFYAPRIRSESQPRWFEVFQEDGEWSYSYFISTEYGSRFNSKNYTMITPRCAVGEWNKIILTQTYDELADTYRKKIFVYDWYHMDTPIYGSHFSPYQDELSVAIGGGTDDKETAEGTKLRNFYYRKVNPGGCFLPDGQYVDHGYSIDSCDKGRCQCDDGLFPCERYSNPCFGQANCDTLLCSMERNATNGEEAIVGKIEAYHSYEMGMELTCTNTSLEEGSSASDEWLSAHIWDGDMSRSFGQEFLLSENDSEDSRLSFNRGNFWMFVLQATSYWGSKFIIGSEYPVGVPNHWNGRGFHVVRPNCIEGWNTMKIVQTYDGTTDTYTKSIHANGKVEFTATFPAADSEMYEGELTVGIGPGHPRWSAPVNTMMRNFYYRKLD